MEQTLFLSEIGTLETSQAQTQNQISSGLAFTLPSQDPVAAGEVAQYNEALAQSQQYTSNANGAQTSLNTESNALTQVESQLQSLYSLTVQANSGTVSAANMNSIATQVQQIQSSLLNLANTQDGNGNYIFSGYATQTQPFTATATGATYNGDQGQPQVQIAAGQTVATGDNGDSVFNQIRNGNGTFTVSAAPGNAGSGLIGSSSVTSPGAYATAQANAATAGPYTITFGGTAGSPSTTYTVTNAAGTVASGTYTSGQAITFGGAQVTLSGAPTGGDQFNVAPSTSQSLFTTVQNLVSTLTSGATGTQLGNALTGSLADLQQGLNQVATLQSSIGGRLNTVTTQLSVATSQQTQLQKSIGSLQGLDYASAITTLDSENTTLSAALQSFAQIQGLTLFKYL
jgi:flagellar hook-associated protein 3 FlgL